MSRKGKNGRVMWAILLVTLLMLGLLSGIGQAADAEPEWLTLPDSNFDPGPGWPDGWSPPAAPTAITPERQAEYEEIIGAMAPAERPDQLLFRVEPEPSWADEYPYKWKYNFTRCGQTAYLYYYRYPDTWLAGQMDGEHYFYTESSGGECGYDRVTGISTPIKPTPEQIEYNRLVDQVRDDTRAAQKGLDDCPFWTENHVEAILVCFNEGDASKSFDVSAYLDPAVSRVRVPVRFVSELMGAEVTWDEVARQVIIDLPETNREIVKVVTEPGYAPVDWWIPETDLLQRDAFDLKKVTISQPARQIVLTVGDQTAYIDGQSVTIDAPPVIVPPGRTMVPLRFVSEQLGAKVYWVGRDPIFESWGRPVGTYQVHIFTPFHPWYDAPSWFLETRATKS